MLRRGCEVREAIQREPLSRFARERGEGWFVNACEATPPPMRGLDIGISCDEVEEGLLALDVEVQRPLRDTERRSHVRHLRARIPLVDEDLRRAVHQPFQPIIRHSPRHAHGRILTDWVSQEAARGNALVGPTPLGYAFLW